ncbi:substrate-binding domain-containing protein [Laribacter hongkongensis]|uniref:substrate-binding domain-containing protein n=1 Tax=Laribacter hongkongensis TaxID=168471 RepID=UPI001EFD491C|nr:substrate-binding domain-containing protein [Laribacter hongkongensis]MCG9040989.1 substrate-binding domain-containing protein [Laribacter hongkongensis]MCG9066448.1 substrate-binding domain-containing protein [Laribacter hongkongensis]MCG9089894.1 substrate-binding domain-containing protein [Laribacter hongkongensis]
MNTLARFAITLLVLLGLGGCQDENRPRIEAVTTASAASPESGKATGNLPRIALVMKSLSNPYFIEMEKGARQAQTENRAELFVKAVGLETSIDQQIQFIDDIINNKSADAIIIVPTDSSRLAPVIARAHKAGIHIINLDTHLDADALAQEGIDPLPFIGVDNHRAAYKAAAHLAASLPPKSEVAIIEGNSNAINALRRSEGARQALEAAGMRLVASQSSWTIEQAYEITGNLLKQNPELRGIYCISDLIALGVIRYLADHGIRQVKVAGFDGIAQARAALASNQMVATVDQRPAEQGYLSVKAALDAIAGKPVTGQIKVETELLTRTSVRQP